MNIFVAKLSSVTKAEDLQELFSKFGEVISAKVIMDRETGRARGFAFVEMAEKSDGIKAIAALNGKSLKERDMVVNESRPREERSGGGGGRGGYGGGGGYKGGGGGYGKSGW